MSRTNAHLRDGKLWDERTVQPRPIPNEATVIKAVEERDAAARTHLDIRTRLAAICGTTS